MSVQIFILSKLMEQNTYPYQLKSQLSEPIPFDKMSGLTESKLYYHFDSLKKKGLIEVTQTVREENRPDKQIFAITDQGKDALPSMIYKLFENANQITEMYIGIANLKYVNKKKIIYILEDKAKDIQDKLQQTSKYYNYIEVPKENQKLLDFMSNHFKTKAEHTIQSLEELINSIKEFDN